MENWSVHQLFSEANSSLGKEPALSLRAYASSLIAKNLPVIFSLRHLAKITQSDFSFLRETVRRNREACNYRMYSIRKRSGGRRFIHSASEKLLNVQKFINSEILQKSPVHSASYAFHANGGIRKCAARHCGAKWLFKFDIEDFFYSISEADVYSVFSKMGYRPLLSFELARICTTLRLPRNIPQFRRCERNEADFPYEKRVNFLGALPQGAPTSPMLANLVARELDAMLDEIAHQYGFVYTRYADDITFSAAEMPSNISVSDMMGLVCSSIFNAGFKNNKSKMHVAGPGARKVVLGLLVDSDSPRLSKNAVKRIDRLLHAASKYGLEKAAEHDAFDSAFGYYNHLSGLVAYAQDADPVRGRVFAQRLRDISIPWDS